MAVIGGCLFVLMAVLVGFSMAGGHVHALIHPSEFVTIGGASFGALIVMAPKKVMMDLFKAVLGLMKGSPYNKAASIEMLKLLSALAKMVRRDGFLALESVISNPSASPVLKKYPRVYGNHHAKEFLCDALGLIADGKADPKQLTEALDEEIRVIEKEHHAAVGVLAKTADALPGFGIVAAVLGIVITMQAIDGPAEEIGHKVGAALVGTFLGILAAYGFFNPMAGRMEFLGEVEANFYRAMATGVVAISGGENPRDVVTRARRSLGTEYRPSHSELALIFNEGG
jgi:chemotaxis protein MotA